MSECPGPANRYFILIILPGRATLYESMPTFEIPNWKIVRMREVDRSKEIDHYEASDGKKYVRPIPGNIAFRLFKNFETIDQAYKAIDRAKLEIIRQVTGGRSEIKQDDPKQKKAMEDFQRKWDELMDETQELTIRQISFMDLHSEQCPLSLETATRLSIFFNEDEEPEIKAPQSSPDDTPEAEPENEEKRDGK